MTMFILFLITPIGIYIYAAEHIIQQIRISYLAGRSIFSRVPITH